MIVDDMGKEHDERDKRTGCGYFIPYRSATGYRVQEYNISFNYVIFHPFI